MQTVTYPATHEGTQADVALTNGIALRFTAHVPARYSPRAGRLEWYHEDSWVVNVYLVLPNGSALEHEPLLACFTHTNASIRDLVKLLGALGETDIAAPDQAVELIRQMRDDTVAAALAWNAAKEARKTARKNLTA